MSMSYRNIWHVSGSHFSDRLFLLPKPALTETTLLSIHEQT